MQNAMPTVRAVRIGTRIGLFLIAACWGLNSPAGQPKATTSLSSEQEFVARVAHAYRDQMSRLGHQPSGAEERFFDACSNGDTGAIRDAYASCLSTNRGLVLGPVFLVVDKTYIVFDIMASSNPSLARDLAAKAVGQLPAQSVYFTSGNFGVLVEAVALTSRTNPPVFLNVNRLCSPELEYWRAAFAGRLQLPSPSEINATFKRSTPQAWTTQNPSIIQAWNFGILKMIVSTNTDWQCFMEPPEVWPNSFYPDALPKNMTPCAIGLSLNQSAAVKQTTGEVWKCFVLNASDDARFKSDWWTQEKLVDWTLGVLNPAAKPFMRSGSESICQVENEVFLRQLVDLSPTHIAASGRLSNSHINAKRLDAAIAVYANLLKQTQKVPAIAFLKERCKFIESRLGCLHAVQAGWDTIQAFDAAQRAGNVTLTNAVDVMDVFLRGQYRVNDAYGMVQRIPSTAIQDALRLAEERGHREVRDFIRQEQSRRQSAPAPR